LSLRAANHPEPVLSPAHGQGGAGHRPQTGRTGNPAVLVVAPSIRPWLAKIVRHRISELIVLSYTEIPDDQSVKVIYTVEAQAKS
jgi:flagellar biosynthesis protein FlhA